MYRDGVTIAIPNWNQELLLPRSVASALRAVTLLRAAGIPGEVLVVDDGSRDGSLALLRQLEALYFQDGLRVLALPVRAVSVAARNRGLAQARYRHVVFMDAANELIPENLPDFLRTLRQTEAAAVYGNLLYSGVSSECAHYVANNESFQDVTFERHHLGGFGLFDRLQLLDVGGFDDGDMTPEDAEIWLHLACNGRRVVFVPLVFGYCYVLPDSTDAAGSNTQAGSLRRAFDQVSARKHLPLNTDRLRYHPAIGYL